MCHRWILQLMIPAAALVAVPTLVAMELSGNVEIQARAFVQEPVSPVQRDGDLSLSLETELYHDWSERNEYLAFKPFFRLDQNDSRRTHFDMRELYWQKVWSNWELAIGLKRVFWGVTESQHLVDFINQTDQVENIDGEDKLGQPMVQLTWIRNWGVIEAYGLPYFRERTFPGSEGRLRGPLEIAADDAVYESDAKDYHFDWALRWSHTLGEIDIGFAHFSGTHRAPALMPSRQPDGRTVLVPYYFQTDRTSLDLQWTRESILWKLEAVSEENRSERSFAAVGGFERTWFGVFGSLYDMGLLAEYHYDDRKDTAPTIFENDLFIGSRLDFNDVQSTAILAGTVVDLDSRATSIFVEASRRLGESLTIELELRGFLNAPATDQLYPVSRDDHILLNLQRHF